MHDWIGGSPRPEHRTVVARTGLPAAARTGFSWKRTPVRCDRGQPRARQQGRRHRGGPDPFAEGPTRRSPCGSPGTPPGRTAIGGSSLRRRHRTAAPTAPGPTARQRQCLNIVCALARPRRLTLSPESASNTVGDEHCVTATVATRTAAHSGRRWLPVDLPRCGGAECRRRQHRTFCYDDPVAPRTDEIIASPTATPRTPRMPVSRAPRPRSHGSSRTRTRAAVMGIGSLMASNGDAATFSMNVHVHSTVRVHARYFYEDQGPAESLVVRSSHDRASPAWRTQQHLRDGPGSGRCLPHRVPTASAFTGSAPPTDTTRASGRWRAATSGSTSPPGLIGQRGCRSWTRGGPSPDTGRASRRCVERRSCLAGLPLVLAAIGWYRHGQRAVARPSGALRTRRC